MADPVCKPAMAASAAAAGGRARRLADGINDGSDGGSSRPRRELLESVPVPRGAAALEIDIAEEDAEEETEAEPREASLSTPSC